MTNLLSVPQISTITSSEDVGCANQQSQLAREALSLWQAWNEGHERVTEVMFAARHNPEQLAELAMQLDDLDQLRWRAAELTGELLQ